VHVGATLRLLRVGAGLSLRELAERVGVSSAYLSRVENGHDAAPTPDRLIAIARALGIPAGALVDLARQVGPAVAGYLERVPAASALFLEIARRSLSAGQIARVKAFIDAEFPGGNGTRRPVRLADLLAPGRVVQRLRCSDLDDVLDVAASRLVVGTRVSAGVVAELMSSRERDTPTALGNGVLASHAIVPGLPAAAVVITLAADLPLPSRDRRPIRVAVALASPSAGRAHLESLATVARLAAYDVSAELCAASTPTRLIALIEDIEALW
jgi:nitrogen PTS system EIIA component